MESRFKGLLRAGLAGASAIAVLLTSAFATNYKTTNKVYLRSDPSTSAEAVKVVNPGSKVIGIQSSEDGEWMQVAYGETDGYIYKKFLKEIDTPVVNNLIVGDPVDASAISSELLASVSNSVSVNSSVVNVSVPSGSIFNDTGNPGGKDLGQFRLTFYCGCVSCSEGYGTATATGGYCVQGRTIAVDPSVIAYGSKVYIEGFGVFVAEDCGGAIKGNRIDIYVEDHELCDRLGVKYANVTLVQ